LGTAPAARHLVGNAREVTQHHPVVGHFPRFASDGLGNNHWIGVELVAGAFGGESQLGELYPAVARSHVVACCAVVFPVVAQLEAIIAHGT